MHLLIPQILLGLAQTCCCWFTETQTVPCTLRKLLLPLLYFTLLYYLNFPHCKIFLLLGFIMSSFDRCFVSCALTCRLSCYSVVPMWSQFWYVRCRVLLLSSYSCDPHFDIGSVVFCFDHSRVTPHFDIRSVVFRFDHSRVTPQFDVRSVVFCFDHTCVTPTLIYALSCSVLIMPVWPPLWYTLFPSSPSQSANHCIVIGMVTPIYLIVVILSV